MRFARSTLDALSAHVCVLDQRGLILTTNEAWRRFARENGAQLRRVHIRSNYLRVCDAATGEGREAAAAFASGIRAVASGAEGEFSMEYPCHSPEEERWFIGRVTRFREHRSVRVVVAHENISERKRAELTAGRLAAIVESSGDAILGKDLNGTISSWNRGAEKLFGYTAEEMVGSSINRLIPATRHEEEGHILAQIRSGLSVEQFETQRQTRDGRLISVCITASPVREADGTIVGVSKVARDISEKAEAEAALRASRELLENVIRSTPAIVFATDREHRYILANDAYSRFLDRPVQEILGRTHHDFFAPAQADTFVADNDAIMADGESRQIEEVVLGSTLMSIKFPLRDGRQEIVGLCGVITDVTANRQAQASQRESEERFRELADNIREVFWMTDPTQGKVLYVSPAYEKVWGRSSSGLYDDPGAWMEAVHPDDRARIVEAAAIRMVRGDYDETYRIERPDGSVRWIHDRAVPIRSATGDLLRIVGIAEDITERRQLEEQYRQAQKMEALGQLAGGVAHDFNNILAVILGYAELARLGTARDHPVHTSLDQIVIAGERAKHLVQQILVFSRRQPKERRVLSLAQTVTDTVKFLKAALPAEVALEATIDEAPPILADPTQMHQVLFNLCSNAWHSLQGRPGRVDIRLQPVVLDGAAVSALSGLRPGPFVCLSVSDNGEGMDNRTLERIFEPFFTTKEPGKGTGLGLSVVHGIVVEHDGAISVVSEPGRGTTFRLYFPVAQNFVNAEPVSISAARSGEGQRILYLDDEEALVSLAKRLLEQLGYHVTGFTRPAEALEAFRRSPDLFDVVITDLNMPGSSGLDVAAAMLRVRPGMPILLSSGHVSDELRRRAGELGILEVLFKPGTASELCEAIHRLAAKAIRI